MVWAGVRSTGRCGPLFIEGTLDCKSYLDFPNVKVIPALEALHPNAREDSIFQQD